nr:LamG-like jellyroll fold domain-containing protein [Paraglaciecola sp. G1-23]
MQVEEVIIRPAGSADHVNSPFNTKPFQNSDNTNTHNDDTQTNNHISELNSEKLDSPKSSGAKTKSTERKLLGILIVSLTILSILLALLFLLVRDPDNHLGQIVTGKLAIQGFGKIDSNHLYSGEYLSEQDAVIQLTSGELLSIEKQSIIKLFNQSEIELKQGAISIDKPQGNNISIIGTNFTINSAGSNLSVKFKDDVPIVTTGHQNILIPNRWRPQHYWSFDGKGDRAADLAGNATGIPDKGAVRVKGLIGTGAFDFDNTKDARINVGSGGGTVPATGSFAVTDGITIEALIVTRYTGNPLGNNGYGELDEIFRKDQADEDLRILLSFQNDTGKDYLKPEGDFAESLSFGLYLVGQGYHELKLPLDGKNGRPTLTQLKDGKAHHVVATYNVSTGLKAIYLDGQMLAHYQYPAGSKMLSGGSGMANIGNSPNADDESSDNESFSGIIDEVAFYDFALPDYMIRQHFNFFQQGQNYFGLIQNSTDLPQNIHIQLSDQQTYFLDPLTGLPESHNLK